MRYKSGVKESLEDGKKKGGVVMKEFVSLYMFAKYTLKQLKDYYKLEPNEDGFMPYVPPECFQPFDRADNLAIDIAIKLIDEKIKEFEKGEKDEEDTEGTDN